MYSSINGANAAIQTKLNTYATENGQVGGIYSVGLGAKVNGQALQAGFSIAIDNSSGTLKARSFWDVDQFAIGRIGQNLDLPFFIDGGQVYMRSAIIKDGSITNAKIGNVIQSNNYQPNVAGWSLDKGGTFAINGSDGAGRMVINNTQILVYDQSGVLRVVLGRQ